MSLKSIKTLFLVASIYDLILGLVFGLFFKLIYNSFGVAPPENAAYIQLPAFYILIFGIGFYLVFRDPERHRGIVLLGILMKVNFICVAFGHWFAGNLPVFYLPWAVLDVIFLILFIPAYSALNKTEAVAKSA